MDYKESLDGSVPVVFCERLKRWLPVTEHVKCEHFVAEVFDEFGEPVSFVCTYSEDCKNLQPDWADCGEIGRGAPVPEPDDGDD